MSNNPFGPGSGPDDQSFPRTFPPAEQQPQQPAQPQQPMAPQQSSGYGNNGYQNSFGSAPAPDHTPTAVTPQPGATSTPKERKGPSWGGVIAIATVAALLAGGIGAGATYALQSLQNSTSAQETSTADEKIKTADVPDWATIASDAAKSWSPSRWGATEK